MKATPAVPAHRRNQRGIALAFFGVLMLMFTAFAVVGVDVGRLAFTASEVQSMADAAALAAVGEHAAGTVDPSSQTATVVADNTIDGRGGTISDSTAAGIKSLTPGVYDFAQKTFTESTWADPNTNAAEAIGTGTVSNLVAAAIGVVDSTVERRAIAALGPSCLSQVVMPVALEAEEIQQFLNSPNCNNLSPTPLFQVPGDNSCFTSLSDQSANAARGISLLPEQCCKNQSVCGGGESVSVEKGDVIRLITGQVTDLLQVIDGCLQDPDGAGPLQPLRDFVVPVVPAGQCNQGGEVLTFARIHIDHIDLTGNPKSIWVTAICKDDLDGGDPGCAHGGGGNSIALVQ